MYYTTSQATQICGFKTAKMVDYLARTNVVTPSGRSKPGKGRSRLYSFGDLVLLRTVRRLLEAGISVKKLNEALQKYRRDFRDIGPGTQISRYLCTDGVSVYLRDDVASPLVDLNEGGQLAFAFIVDIHHAVREVQEAIPKVVDIKAA